MIWMDILDHPVGIPLETSYLVDEEDAAPEDFSRVEIRRRIPRRQCTWPLASFPFEVPATDPKRYPMLRVSVGAVAKEH